MFTKSTPCAGRQTGRSADQRYLSSVGSSRDKTRQTCPFLAFHSSQMINIINVNELKLEERMLLLFCGGFSH